MSTTAETEDRPCAICGKNPAEGFASTWTAAGGERWYCHGDEDQSPTCYERHDTSAATFFADLLINAPATNTPARRGSESEGAEQ